MPAYFLLDDAPLRVRAGGAWLQGDEPLHARVATLFARHVVVDEAGAYVLRLGFEEAPLLVDDTPFVVRSAQPEHEGGQLIAVTLRLSDGATELLEPHALWQTGENVVYCGIRRSGYLVPARLAAAHYHTLAQDIVAEQGSFALHVGGRRIPIVRVAQAPRPARLP